MNEYVDVRGPVPTYVKGVRAVSLQSQDRIASRDIPVALARVAAEGIVRENTVEAPPRSESW